jgi:hypothetical protein
MGHPYCGNMIPTVILLSGTSSYYFTFTWKFHPTGDLYFISFPFYSLCYPVRLCFPIPFPRASSNKRNTTHSLQRSHVAINFKRKGIWSPCSEREKNAYLHKSLSWHSESGYWNNNFIVLYINYRCQHFLNIVLAPILLRHVIHLTLVWGLKQHKWYQAKCSFCVIASHSKRALAGGHVIVLMENYVCWISIDN